MIGVIVNTLTVLVGSTLGTLISRGIPEKISKAIMSVIGLCTIYIGVDGALAGSNTIVMIISMVIGTAVGTLLDIDGKINRLGGLIESRVKHGTGSKASITEGFMTGSLLFCMGAMTIVGSLNSGLNGDNTLIFTKSVLDLISSFMLASSLGIGVVFASAFVLVFQGALVLLSGLLQNILTDPAMTAEITCVGSVMIIGLGLNIMGITKLKIADMLPTVFITPLIYIGVQYIPLING